MPDPRKMQVNLLGFMDKHGAAHFTELLWNLLISAQNTVGGVPAEVSLHPSILIVPTDYLGETRYGGLTGYSSSRQRRRRFKCSKQWVSNRLRIYPNVLRPRLRVGRGRRYVLPLGQRRIPARDKLLLRVGRRTDLDRMKSRTSPPLDRGQERGTDHQEVIVVEVEVGVEEAESKGGSPLDSKIGATDQEAGIHLEGMIEEDTAEGEGMIEEDTAGGEEMIEEDTVVEGVLTIGTESEEEIGTEGTVDLTELIEATPEVNEMRLEEEGEEKEG